MAVIASKSSVDAACAAALLVSVAFLSAGCQSIPRHKVHYTLIEPAERAQPTELVLLPVDIRVSEIAAGGVTEEVGAWSEQARSNVREALMGYATKRKDMSLERLPPLGVHTLQVVDEHVALYDVVAGNAFFLTSFGGSAWRHKALHFDYTLGGGLQPLKDRTGADAALIVVGFDQISSDERKAAAVAAALFGVGIPLGTAFLSTGVVDLATGDILWFNYVSSYANKDLRNAEDAAEMVDLLLKDYPGLEAYQDIKVTTR